MNKKVFSLILFFTITFIISTLIGGESLFFTEWDESNKYIFFELRLPRVILSYIVGSSLALAGLVFQSLFRNELATPYTLGVSSGAAFSVCLFLQFGISFSIFGLSGLGVAGLSGALLSVFIILIISSILKRFDSQTLILTGVAQGMFFSSAILLFQFLSNEFEVTEIIRWSAGGLDTVGYSSVLRIIPIFVTAVFFTLYNANTFNILFISEELALSQGVNTETFRKLSFIMISFLLGIVIAEVGPIGFIGLMAPHVMRIWFKNDFKILIPTSLIFGGSLLAFCDFIGRIISDQIEIPVGIVTAFLGGPFFLYILVKGSRARSV